MLRSRGLKGATSPKFIPSLPNITYISVRVFKLIAHSFIKLSSKNPKIVPKCHAFNAPPTESAAGQHPKSNLIFILTHIMCVQEFKLIPQWVLELLSGNHQIVPKNGRFASAAAVQCEDYAQHRTWPSFYHIKCSCQFLEISIKAFSSYHAETKPAEEQTKKQKQKIMAKTISIPLFKGYLISEVMHYNYIRLSWIYQTILHKLQNT